MPTQRNKTAIAWHLRAAGLALPVIVAFQGWLGLSVLGLRADCLTNADGERIMQEVDDDAAVRFTAVLRSLDRVNQQLDSLAERQKEILLRLGANKEGTDGKAFSP